MAKAYLQGKITNLLREEVGLNVEGQKVEEKIRTLVFAEVLLLWG